MLPEHNVLKPKVSFTCISPCPVCCPEESQVPRAEGLWCKASPSPSTADRSRNCSDCQCCRRRRRHRPNLNNAHSWPAHPYMEKERSICMQSYTSDICIQKIDFIWSAWSPFYTNCGMGIVGKCTIQNQDRNIKCVKYVEVITWSAVSITFTRTGCWSTTSSEEYVSSENRL